VFLLIPIKSQRGKGGKKMSMRMAITKVLCCLVLIAILMNATPVSVLARNSNNASNSVSNHPDLSASLSLNVIYVPDAKDNRASPKQCNITAISSTGSAIFDTAIKLMEV